MNRTSITESSTNTSAHDSHAKPRPPPPPTDNRMHDPKQGRPNPPSNSQPHPHSTGRPRPESINNGPSSSVHTRTEHKPIPNNNVNTKKIPFGSRSVEVYEKLEQIGEGTYGEVYMARNRENSDIVALKKIRMENEKEGFPITAIREIKILKELHHNNVVQLKEIVTGSSKDKKETSVYMVFEYMDHDLTGLMTNESNSWRPTPAHVKCYMKQLLEGLHYCHSKGVLHRDIKGSNLLISNQGQLKLADFGLARAFTSQQSHYTNKVITLWYRPPELLLGAVDYGPAIDIWSAGCIFAELLTKKPIFPGKNEADELDLIYEICGTPTEEGDVWPGYHKLPLSHMVPKTIKKRCLRERFKQFPPETIDLLDQMLTLDPSKRITATQALDHNYFWTEPLPCEPSALPKHPTSHEYQTKKRRAVVQQSQDMAKKAKPIGYTGGPPQQQQHHGNAPPYRGGPPPPRGPPPPPPHHRPQDAHHPRGGHHPPPPPSDPNRPRPPPPPRQ